MSLIPFGEWTPDQPALGTGSIEALNAIPEARSYGPFPKFGANSTVPVVAKCQGAGMFRSDTGVIGSYCGDASKLYRLVGTTWTDASKVGGYSTDPAGRWVFISFGDLVLATNGVDPIQKIQIDGGTTFANLGGSPPVCRYLAVTKDYVVAGWLSSDVTAAQWCATNNPESWPIASGGGDIQPLADTGEVTGVVGGDFFQAKTERGVHRFDFVGGDIVFQRRQTGFGVGAAIPGTVQGFNDRSFFYHGTGFYQCISGSVPIPIGNERVNKYFLSRLASGGRDFVFSAIDPVSSLYAVGFNTDGASGYPIKEVLLFKWDAGQPGRWSHIIDGNAYDIIFSGLSATNVTLEDLDVYGSLEAVPFPLDSPVWLGQGNQLFGAFSSAHNSGWFNGDNMDATLTTTKAKLNDGGMALVRGYRAMLEATSPPTIAGTVYAQDTLTSVGATNANSSAKSPNARGLIRARIKGRYHWAQITLSGDWDHALGIDDLEVYNLGNR